VPLSVANGNNLTIFCSSVQTGQKRLGEKIMSGKVLGNGRK